MSRRDRVDVHQHFLPPFYTARVRERGLHEAAGRDLPPWSADGALALMDRHEIARSVLSISTPGVRLDASPQGAKEARELARRTNEFAAELARAYPARFGFFAILPLPDVEGALAESAYALDELGADGVVLLANTHGRYLGEPDDEPLYAELNRRRAVVFVHPSTLPAPPVPGVPPFAADFLLDTTRAAFRLVQCGAMRRHRDWKVILSHAGGFVPYASHRLWITLAGQGVGRPADLLDDFRSFYFDSALSGSPAALPSLLAFAKPGHVLFGSDWPFAPDPAVAYFTGRLDAYAALDAAGHAAIDRDNARALFARRP